MILKLVIYAKEYGDLATIYIPNFFTHTPIDKKPGEDKIIMGINGLLVDIMVQTDPEKYGPNVVYEKGKKVIYLKLLKDMYGMLQSALLSYINMRKDLET